MCFSLPWLKSLWRDFFNILFSDYQSGSFFSQNSACPSAGSSS